MPNFQGGVVVTDDELRSNVFAVVSSFKHPPVANAQGLADSIECEVSAFKEMEAVALKVDPSPKVKAYLKKLEAARKSYLNIPEEVRAILPDLFPYAGLSLFPADMLRVFAVAQYEPHMLASLVSDACRSGKSKDELSRLGTSLERRKEGLCNEDYWGADVEMLDLLVATANKYLLDHVEPIVAGKRRRYRPDVRLIRRLIPVCNGFGVTASAAEDSYFTAIVRAVMEHLGDGYRTTNKQQIEGQSPSYRHAIEAAMGEE